jgi:ankyrin repeat protein
VKFIFAVQILALLISGCGYHETESYGQINTGNITKVEKSTEPADVAQAAIRADDAKALTAVLDTGLAVDTILKNGRPLLVEAVIWEKLVALQLLVEKGARIDLADADGKDALTHAQGRPAVLRLLQPTSNTDAKKLYAAVNGNQFNVVKTMLAEGVDPNQILEDGETALTLSVKLGFENVVRVLLQPTTKTDVNLPNSKGERALAIAIRSGKSRIESLLKQRGARP